MSRFRCCCWTVAGMAVVFSTANASEAKDVLAINVGGPAVVALDGTAFIADQGFDGGETGSIEAISGTQDPALYQSYREGDFSYDLPVQDGTWDLTLHFAEPRTLEPGDRVFNVLAEGETVLQDVDILLWRDGKPGAGLSVTVPDIAVSDGQLNLEFDASAGDPLLSAIVVRPPHRPAISGPPVWQDEFDIDGAPDPDKWTIEEWEPRRVNDEDQAYTARPKNVRVQDGLLVIEAHREKYAGARYTSGRIHSQGKGGFLYGRVEIRANLPQGQGTWPAIWMMPDDFYRYATTCTSETGWTNDPPCDAWPNSGEIDIMEHVGYQMNHVHGTMHTKAYYWVNSQQRKGRIVLDDVADTFHVYAAEWSPDRIDVFVDDTYYFSYVNENDSWEQWPFDHPFHVILNVAIGGHWGRAGGPIDERIFPQRMLIDYVRIYE